MRMGATCPGYRVTVGQNFRNETESVVRRAQKSYRKPNQCGAGQQGPVRCDAVNVATVAVQLDYTLSSMSNTFTLTPSMIDVAVMNFMSSYIPGSHFDYLPPMYGLVSSESALSLTVEAAAMAYLSQELCQSNLMYAARRSYTRALHETNEALAHASTASSNSTLVSVLLLGLFESLIWTHTGTPEYWTKHSKGAFAIIKLRGLQQLETAMGQQLFTQVANIVCINSLQHRARLPKGLEDLIERVLQIEPDSPPYQLTRLTCKVSNLIADVHANVETASEAIQMLCELDAEYIQFAKHLPRNWQCERSVLGSQEEMFHGDMGHWYPDHRALRLWNSYRMTRILLNEAVHALANNVSTEVKTKSQQQAVGNIEEMSTEICASISYFVSCSKLLRNVKDATSMALTFANSRALAASLLWPLSAVRGASLASENIRAYSVLKLRFLAVEARVPQASQIASRGTGFDALQDGLHISYVS
jgi:hypothetical protein